MALINNRLLFAIELLLIMVISIVWLTIITISVSRAYQVRQQEFQNIVKTGHQRPTTKSRTPFDNQQSHQIQTNHHSDKLTEQLRVFLKVGNTVVHIFIQLTNLILYQKPDVYEKKYGLFSHQDRIKSRDEAKRMFEFAYDSYMTHAFPQDELNPIDCVGRGPDVDNPLVTTAEHMF